MVTTEQPSSLSYKAISEYAELVYSTFEKTITDDKPNAKKTQASNIRKLVEVLGGELEYRETGESMVVVREGEFTIFLPFMSSTRRDRFTIAHELGHYYLHYLQLDIQGRRVFTRRGSHRLETQANVFASSLLMPKTRFEVAYRKYSGDLIKLARAFDVSVPAASVRCQVLRLGVD